ncbi:hypothetical protein ACFFUT_05640 [Pseudohalocynthiibacter aestuariivivens]|uniref:Uncharacterized protein n=1 Tax=Pseudohalocynthiibacter aestuariivivens TaxID=1591409 RepID=A0ABV5JCS8_9RHOB|nr:hypothetical protein [Pseudohalocynthiibacter aestuariivivens]MBS9717244.1 hypothetical protein [Pseudohalocynthiibacter aestuariivivens]
MTLDAETMEFLELEFPEKSRDELEHAFGWVYEESRFRDEEDQFRDDGNKMARTERITAFENVIEDINTWPSFGHLLGLSVMAILKNLNKDDFKGIISSVDIESASLEDIRKELLIRMDCINIWYKGNPINGGLNVPADLIAKAVKYAFNELEIDAHYGGKKHKSAPPSTSYGRVVKHALYHHDSPVHWRHPTQRNADKKQTIRYKTCRPKKPD